MILKSDVAHLVIETLMLREDYARSVLPYLKDEYFEMQEEQIVFGKIRDYIDKYNALPTPEVLSIDLHNDPNVLDNTIDFFVDFAKDIETTDKSMEWLLSTTEQFCKDRALYIALEQSIEIAQESDGSSGLSRGALPQIFQDALNVSFDDNVGHNYIDDADERFEFYNNSEERLAFDIDELNKITDGGIPKKTLNVVMGPSGCGKCSKSSDFINIFVEQQNQSSLEEFLYEYRKQKNI